MLAQPAQALVLAAFCAADLVLAQVPSAMEKASLANAGFERGEAGHVPEGWTHRKGRRCGGSVSLSAERAHTGKCSIKLESKHGEYCVVSGTPVPCVGGQRVRAAGYVFNEGNYEQLSLVFGRAGYDLRGKDAYVRASNSTRGKWTRIEVEATAPARAESVSVQLYLTLGARGSHYFDTIELWRTPMPEEPTAPPNIGTKKELFVDDYLIAEQRDVEIVLNPGKKHPGNPIFRVEKPWEGWRTYLYGTVLFDEDDGLFKMWYIVVGTRAFTCYATSKDGIHWDRPVLALPKLRKYGEGSNIVGRFHMANVMKDKSDPDPARRWKMICYDPRRLPGVDPKDKSWETRWGYCTLVSPDGIRWDHNTSGPIAYVDGGGDVITGCYDEATKRYLALLKIHTPVGRFGRRSFALTTSQDFQAWTEPKLVLTTDRTDDEGIMSRLDAARPIMQHPIEPDRMHADFYGLGLMPYGNVHLGFVWVLWISNSSLYGRSKQDGPETVQLACTRDLHHWHRCGGRRQIIQQGIARTPPHQDWDSGGISTASRPIIVGDEVWLYYGGHNITHGDRSLYFADDTRRGKEATGAIGLATWRLDGFMSVNAGDRPGSLTTKPLTFEGDRLVVNVDAQAGRFAAEILDEGGKPLPGFDNASCDAFAGDSVRHTVTWGGKADVSSLKGTAVCLRFELANAKLYSYRFAAAQ